MQYRDFFDNHHPLFHLLTAPFAALVGERSTALLWMRLPMLALFGVVMWATYVLGRRLYDERIAGGLIPDPRWGRPDDVGAVVAMLLRDDVRYATGSVVHVDGGLAIPRL